MNAQKDPTNISARIEFHRNAAALLPDAEDKRPGVAFIQTDDKGRETRFCTCSGSRSRTCAHMKALAVACKPHLDQKGCLTLADQFRQTLWYRIADLLAEECRQPPDSIRFQRHRKNGHQHLAALTGGGERLLIYRSGQSDQARFMERCGVVPDDPLLPHRGVVLDKLAAMTLSETERTMGAMGMQSRRQALESSFWYRVAYHGFREFGADQCAFEPAVNPRTGDFVVTCTEKKRGIIFNANIPRLAVRSLLTELRERLPNQNNMAIHPIPLKSLFKVSRRTEMDLEVRPMIKLLQADGEAKFFERADLEKFRYGTLVYIKELGILAELERQGRNRQFKTPVRMTFKKYQVPEFLEAAGDALFSDQYLIDSDVKDLKIIKTFDRVEIAPEALDRDWCWLSVRYGFGDTRISLAEILHAAAQGQRFIATNEGWVDCLSPEVKRVKDRIVGDQDGEIRERDGKIRLSRMALLRFGAATETPVEVDGEAPSSDILKKMMAAVPATPVPDIPGMASALRPYQAQGVNWLWYLMENGFGGLLCDDMGLGKTHQTMAFMLCLKALRENNRPFIVVCPTTVISHWRRKIKEHAPALNVVVYHGGERDLSGLDERHAVLITSYGILLRDVEKLRCVRFELAVFDEIQHIKNANTKSYQAAVDLDAEMKLGLTGTPIENSLWELKALMDLTLPGYLGADAHFRDHYADPVAQKNHTRRKAELRRLIHPFILRRLKCTVLHELPEKIEDIRICELSADQVRLYREAVEGRAADLLAALRRDNTPVPYIHIFALLTLLKQICNHPALVEKSHDDIDRLTSGKWELFKELLSESLDSGQKVVVFSQYVKMIRIIENYLKREAIGFVTLTGGTRKRGERIDRFNTDPGCKVFLGSLKAGGSGIDLVGGSVVIHYDRWWNAAKEDQATDRVYRIGQKRGVQVFKLVTEGTLEEKISAIIEKKRKLMNSVVAEDDPEVLKIFSRNQLMELLSAPLREAGDVSIS